MSGSRQEVKRGIVYIAQELDHELTLGQGRFYGRWEVGDDADTFVEGPGWDDPSDAIAWGRGRAAEVYIRVDGTAPQTYYSAGDVHDAGELADDPMPRWPG